MMQKMFAHQNIIVSLQTIQDTLSYVYEVIIGSIIHHMAIQLVLIVSSKPK